MFEDELLDDSDWEEIVRKLDKFYTGKDGKAEMDRISLQFDLHNVSDGNEELKPMCSLFSYPIINSKSRLPLNIHMSADKTLTFFQESWHP